MQAVELAPAAEAVGPLEEFVAEAGAHFGGVWDDVAGVAEVEALGVFSAEFHSESVLEAAGLGGFFIETQGVALVDALVDVARVGGGGFVEDGSKGRAGGLHIVVEGA